MRVETTSRLEGWKGPHAGNSQAGLSGSELEDERKTSPAYLRLSVEQ